MGGVWEGQKLVFTRVCVCGLGRRRLNAGSCPRANRKSSITRTKNHLNTSQILEKKHWDHWGKHFTECVGKAVWDVEGCLITMDEKSNCGLFAIEMETIFLSHTDT